MLRSTRSRPCWPAQHGHACVAPGPGYLRCGGKSGMSQLVTRIRDAATRPHLANLGQGAGVANDRHSKRVESRFVGRRRPANDGGAGVRKRRRPMRPSGRPARAPLVNPAETNDGCAARSTGRGRNGSVVASGACAASIPLRAEPQRGPTRRRGRPAPTSGKSACRAGPPRPRTERFTRRTRNAQPSAHTDHLVGTEAFRDRG